MTREASSQKVLRQELEHQVMRLYGQWPDRTTCHTAARPLAFFVWLESHHPHLTEVGVFGPRGTYQQISALTARWESLYGAEQPT